MDAELGSQPYAAGWRWLRERVRWGKERASAGPNAADAYFLL